MPTELSLIVVEDNELLREEMVCFLTRPGWQAHGVDCGEELNIWLTGNTPDIAVLDVNLPYENGYSIAARLRENYPSMGIIMLTARVRHSERTTGYQAGADVYLTKPTHPAELMAVIDNLGRRLQPREISQFMLDRTASALIAPLGDRCLLTLSELRLLELLVAASGREANIDYLLQAMSTREDRAVSKEALAALISRLRSKCKKALGIHNLVVAHRGVGYRLTVALRVQD